MFEYTTKDVLGMLAAVMAVGADYLGIYRRWRLAALLLIIAMMLGVACFVA